jgi:ABC-type metal ion transport system substrate-binding protein
MKKQIGIAHCPTNEKRTLAILDKEKGWIWVETFKTKER